MFIVSEILSFYFVYDIPTMLYCLVHGNAIRETFLVTSNEKMGVSQLREIIRQEKEHYFNNTDANQLIL
jgi:hypothetical protein